MKKSHYKTEKDLEWVRDWTNRCLLAFSLPFQSRFVLTSYGNTHVYAYNNDKKNLPAIVCVPGFRTTTAYWALNNNLEPFRDKYRIFLIENIGQPGLSDGNNLNILGKDYGKWLDELTTKLEITNALWIGASFGCQLIVKLSQVNPQKIKKAVFICPAGFVQMSMKWNSMGVNLLFAAYPNEKTKNDFLNNIVYGKKTVVDETSKLLINEGIYETVKRFTMLTMPPYPALSSEFKNMTMPIMILSGESDTMFSPTRLRKRIANVLEKQPVFEVLEGHHHAAEVSNLPYLKAAGFFRYE